MIWFSLGLSLQSMKIQIMVKYSQFSFQIAKKNVSLYSESTLFSDTLLLEPLRTNSKYHLQWWRETLRHFIEFIGGCANVTKQQRIVGWKAKGRKWRVYLEDIYWKIWDICEHFGVCTVFLKLRSNGNIAEWEVDPKHHTKG